MKKWLHQTTGLLGCPAAALERCLDASALQNITLHRVWLARKEAAVAMTGAASKVTFDCGCRREVEKCYTVP